MVGAGDRIRAGKRIVQAGIEGRGLPQFTEPRRRYIQQPPPGMDRKPGPGPKVPWNPGICFSPYKWLHYDGGMIMGIAIHVIDSAHHWLGLQEPASAVAGICPRHPHAPATRRSLMAGTLRLRTHG